MGLDMYLRARKYVSGWPHNPASETNEYERLIELFGMEEFVTDDSPSAYVEFTVGYWRKANHIHEWFVQNVQDGVDECQRAYVPREKLVELRDACQFVLGTREKVGVNVGAADRIAAEKLPTQEGFFFGTTEYDEWYWSGTQDTVEIIDKCLSLPGEWEYEYQSSW